MMACPQFLCEMILAIISVCRGLPSFMLAATSCGASLWIVTPTTQASKGSACAVTQRAALLPLAEVYASNISHRYQLQHHTLWCTVASSDECWRRLCCAVVKCVDVHCGCN